MTLALRTTREAKSTWQQRPRRWMALPLLLSCALSGVASAQTDAAVPTAADVQSAESLSFPGLRFEDAAFPRPAEPPSLFRERDEVLLGYEAPLRLGENDLLFKLRAPGKRRSFVTFEVVF